MSQSTTPYRSSVLAEFRRAITNVAVPHHEPPGIVRRRRVVVGVTLVIGAVMLGFSLRRTPGESSFYWLTLALAAVWIAGALMSGPLHLGGICWRGRNQRPVITGTTVGLLLAGIFGVGAMIVRAIPGAAEPIARVLQFAHQGTLLPILLITLINGIAEEMFFRGALYTALGRRYPVTISTVLYVGATMASANLMLGFAAIFVGTVCALERRAIQMMWAMRATGMWTDTRGANMLDGGAPYYDTYECADGRYVAVGAIEPQFYAAMLAGLGLDAAELPPQNDRARWPELRALLTEAFASHDRDHWGAVFANSDACVTPVLAFGEVHNEPHIIERNTFYEANGGWQPMPAPRFSRTASSQPRPPAATIDIEAVLTDWDG